MCIPSDLAVILQSTDPEKSVRDVPTDTFCLGYERKELEATWVTFLIKMDKDVKYTVEISEAVKSNQVSLHISRYVWLIKQKAKNYINYIHIK